MIILSKKNNSNRADRFHPIDIFFTEMEWNEFVDQCEQKFPFSNNLRVSPDRDFVDFFTILTELREESMSKWMEYEKRFQRNHRLK